jgi:nickel-dependent lactate racemase
MPGTKKYHLKYGSEKVKLEIPEGSTILEVNEPDFQVNRSDFNISLNKLIDIQPGNSIGIIVSDKTRLCGYELYLPWLCEYLESSGVSSRDITFYIAYGTHPVQTDEESLNAYGDTFLKYKFVHHNCDDISSMTFLGTSTSGTKVIVRKDIFSHNKLILFGAISHHYFAGYGGGRKLIFPGLAKRESIYSNHKLFIDFNSSALHPGCQSGQLSGNPVAEDLKEIDDMFPDKLIISGILNTKANVALLKFNRDYSEFMDTCTIYDNSYRSPVKEKFDMVIASAGGYPKDINFIQTHKSMHNAASFVKDKGTLILLGECRDGIGNNSFINIFSGSTGDIVNDLLNNYSGNGGTALSTLSKTSRINVIMLTDLAENDCEKMGVKQIDLQGVNKAIFEEKGSIAIIENGSIIF